MPDGSLKVIVVRGQVERAPDEPSSWHRRHIRESPLKSNAQEALRSNEQQ
jgi:hypothetical protein